MRLHAHCPARGVEPVWSRLCARRVYACARRAPWRARDAQRSRMRVTCMHCQARATTQRARMREKRSRQPEMRACALAWQVLAARLSLCCVYARARARSGRQACPGLHSWPGARALVYGGGAQQGTCVRPVAPSLAEAPGWMLTLPVATQCAIRVVHTAIAAMTDPPQSRDRSQSTSLP